MPASSASSSASTGINAPGGGITKNSPGVIVVIVFGVLVVLWLVMRRKKP